MFPVDSELVLATEGDSITLRSEYDVVFFDIRCIVDHRYLAAEQTVSACITRHVL